MLFATLDPTMRQTELPSGQTIVLADTVGFISQLPTELVEAFKSTLEEVVEADILLHVHDASSPVLFEEASDVSSVLHDIGLPENRLEDDVIHVMNKSDIRDDEMTDAITNEFANAQFTSAVTGEGLDDLLRVIDQHLASDSAVITVTLPPQAGQARAWLYERGDIQDDSFDETGTQHMAVRLRRSDIARFERQFTDIAFVL